jgi:hypothetical protein
MAAAAAANELQEQLLAMEKQLSLHEVGPVIREVVIEASERAVGAA